MYRNYTIALVNLQEQIRNDVWEYAHTNTGSFVNDIVMGIIQSGIDQFALHTNGFALTPVSYPRYFIKQYLYYEDVTTMVDKVVSYLSDMISLAVDVTYLIHPWYYRYLGNIMCLSIDEKEFIINPEGCA